MPDLDISVAELLGHPGQFRDFHISPVLTGVGTALSRLTEKPIGGDLRAESVMEGILVTGGVDGVSVQECARCLRRFDAGLHLELCELFVAPGHEVPEDDDSYKVSGKEIHLEQMLRDALALALPLNPLCRADCKGLCAVCGRNLNDGDCSCEVSTPDPRWAPLEGLRQKLES